MSSVDKQLMESAVTGTHDGLDNRIGWYSSLAGLEGPSKTHLFFLKFGATHKPNLEDFVELLYYKIAQFCIPQTKREEARRKYSETGDERYSLEITDQAKELFLKATDTGVRSGEPGELILYCILEKFFGAPQLVCKMFLKTSRQMPVHGSDGIHVCLDDDGRALNFIWGESKIYQSISSAIDAAAESIHRLVTHAETPISRDIEILKDHTHITSPELRDAVLDALDCYSDAANHKRHSFAALVGFSYEKLAACSSSEERELFFNQYLNDAREATLRFNQKIQEYNLQDYEFMFILVPFASVDEFRKLFFRRLGRVVN